MAVCDIREIAAGWISPSPRDSEITRFATGDSSQVDWELFLEQIEYNRREFLDPNNCEARCELNALEAHGRKMLAKGN